MTGATLPKANPTSADMTYGLLIDINLTGAILECANRNGTIYCRTAMPNRKVDNQNRQSGRERA